MVDHAREQRVASLGILPAQQETEPRDREGDAVIIVGQVDQRKIGPHEASPVEAGTQFGERLRPYRAIEQAGLVQAVERGDIIIGAPGVVRIVDCQVGDGGEIGQPRRRARIVHRHVEQAIGHRRGDLAGQELVACLEDPDPAQHHVATLGEQLVELGVNLGNQPAFDGLVHRWRGDVE